VALEDRLGQTYVCTKVFRDQNVFDLHALVAVDGATSVLLPLAVGILLL
jgi:hypothetical protein